LHFLRKQAALGYHSCVSEDSSILEQLDAEYEGTMILQKFRNYSSNGILLHPALNIQLDIHLTALHLPVMQTALNEADKNEQTADVFWLAGV
jgi:hypothetical protein